MFEIISTLLYLNVRTGFDVALSNPCEIMAVFNPLTSGAAYIRVFIFISTPPFKHVKDKM